MNDLDVMFAQNAAFKYVKVEFNRGNQLYTYKTLFDVQEGDTLVVDTPANGLATVKVVKVVAPHEMGKLNFDIKWVVQVVDTGTYEKLIETENEARKHIQKSQAVKLARDFEDGLKDTIGQEGVEELKKLTKL